MHDRTPTPEVSALRASRESITAAVEELAAFQAGSEKVFLLAASRLGELQRQAHQLVDSAKGAARLSGRDDKNPVERLCQQLAQLEQYLGTARLASGASAEPLRGVLTSLDKLVKSSPEFRRFAQMLNMLGVNIQVENARAGGRRVGMETVAADIRQLGERVEPLFEVILSQAAILRSLAEGALTATEQFLGRQGKSSEAMIAEVRDGVASMRALAGSAAAIAQEASVTSDQVVASISHVLTSVQAHDVTRQMIEHVVEELAAFEGEVSSSPEAAARPEPWLAHAAVLCRLEAAQLRGARQKLVDALSDIARSLRSVSGRLVDLGQATQRLDGDGERGDGRDSPLEKIGRGVTEATRTFQGHLDHQKQTSSAVDRVSQTVQDIAGGLRDIEGIGIEVKFIALNALIKSSKLGSKGRVLSVLAGAVRTLSVEVVQATQEVSKVLNHIADAGAGLKESASAAQLAEGSKIASGLDEIVRQLGQYHEHLRVSIARLTDGGASVQAEVEELVQKLGAQTEAAEALRDVEEALERTAAAAAELAGPAELERARDLSSAFARYTMQEERATHQSVTQSAPAEISNSQGGELGNNVELF